MFIRSCNLYLLISPSHESDLKGFFKEPAKILGLNYRFAPHLNTPFSLFLAFLSNKIKVFGKNCTFIISYCIYKVIRNYTCKQYNFRIFLACMVIKTCRFIPPGKKFLPIQVSGHLYFRVQLNSESLRFCLKMNVIDNINLFTLLLRTQ